MHSLRRNNACLSRRLYLLKLPLSLSFSISLWVAAREQRLAGRRRAARADGPEIYIRSRGSASSSSSGGLFYILLLSLSLHRSLHFSCRGLEEVGRRERGARLLLARFAAAAAEHFLLPSSGLAALSVCLLLLSSRGKSVENAYSAFDSLLRPT